MSSASSTERLFDGFFLSSHGEDIPFRPDRRVCITEPPFYVESVSTQSSQLQLHTNVLRKISDLTLDHVVAYFQRYVQVCQPHLILNVLYENNVFTHFFSTPSGEDVGNITLRLSPYYRLSSEDREKYFAQLEATFSNR